MVDDAPKRRNAHPEWDNQTLIYVYLRRALPPHAYVRSVDSGQAAPAYVKFARKARGILPGQADIRVLCDGISLDIEVKADGGVLSEHQKDNRDSLRANGGHWAECETVDDAELALRAAGLPVLRTAIAHAGIAHMSAPKKTRNWSKPPKKATQKALHVYTRLAAKMR